MNLNSIDAIFLQFNSFLFLFFQLKNPLDWNWTLSTKRIMSCWGLAYFQTTGSNSCSLHTFLMHKNKFSYRWMTGVNGQKHVVFTYKTDAINNDFCGKLYIFFCSVQNSAEIYICLYEKCFSFTLPFREHDFSLAFFLWLPNPSWKYYAQSIKSELSIMII